MGNAANGLIQIESGQNTVTWEALTDAGDHQHFTPSAAIISPAVEAQVRPDGVVTGVNLISPSGSNDKVAVSAFTAYSGGVLRNVAAGEVTLTRPSDNVAKVVSITMTDAGALVAVAGTDGSSAVFSEGRGEAGGPPFIPAGSVELGQVFLTSTTSGVVASSEIHQGGSFTERADFPVYELSHFGAGDSAQVAGETHANLRFASALPLSHTDSKPKGVWMQYATPAFADVARARDFVPVEISHSVSSEAYYGGATASTSSSLGQGSFTVLCDNGVTDFIVSLKNQDVTVKFFPNRNASAYVITQGKLALNRTFPVDASIQAACTVTAGAPSAEFSGQ